MTLKPAILAVAALVLTGCTSIPVGTVALCVGLCRIEIKPPPSQSPAEKAGALAGGLLEQFIKK
jgi:hypothetical protein